MSATSVVGLQWGDEAKGKIVDLLTDEHDVVVRYQGGNNAGHTVVFNGQTYKLSQLPAGILHPRVASVIATGVVINPAALLKEMDSIAARKGPPIDGNLLISDRAHVIFPYHALEEVVLEKSRKGDPIGTTMRGIGPCYCDKAGRTHAVRLGDLKRPDSFRPRIAEIVAYKNVFLRAFDPDLVPLDVDKIYEEYMGYAERLRPFITDTTAYLHRALRRVSQVSSSRRIPDLTNTNMPSDSGSTYSSSSLTKTSSPARSESSLTSNNSSPSFNPTLPPKEFIPRTSLLSTSDSLQACAFFSQARSVIIHKMIPPTPKLILRTEHFVV